MKEHKDAFEKLKDVGFDREGFRRDLLGVK
jgi:hypothetical protein